MTKIQNDEIKSIIIHQGQRNQRRMSDTDNAKKQPKKGNYC